MRRGKPVYDAQRHERWHMTTARWIKLGACVLGTLLMQHWLQNWAAALVLTATLWGIFLAPELIGLFGDMGRWLRWARWHEREGLHYEFKGVHIRVQEEHRERWLCLEDLGRALGEPPNELVLRRLNEDGVREYERQLYVQDELLLKYLAERSSDRAISLRTWVQRTVFHPARQRR